jgi:hypothetical protein
MTEVCGDAEIGDSGNELIPVITGGLIEENI